MADRGKIKVLSDFFQPLSQRPEKSTYFYRIHGYSEEVHRFIKEYYNCARTRGVVIEGRIPNPTEQNLSYYGEMMGMDFRLEQSFIEARLKKWLPRIHEVPASLVASSVYDLLCGLKAAGKNENMLKNAYIKFMCWLYYKFERIVNLLGENEAPKLLYEGEITQYELLLISILSGAGCDVVLLQYQGDAAYLKLDAASVYSDAYSSSGTTAFPSGYCLAKLRQEMEKDRQLQRLYGQKPQHLNCTNAWIEGKGLEDIKKPAAARGEDSAFFYNCFIRLRGCEDKLIYANELYQFHQELQQSKRRLVLIEKAIEMPSPAEIGKIKRKNYGNKEQLLADMTLNISSSFGMELQRLMVRAFLDVLLEEDKKEEMTLNKMLNQAVRLLCWLKRYEAGLFGSWKYPEIGCLIYFGACQTAGEALFLKLLAKLPADVLIIQTDRNQQSCLEDELLYEVNGEESLVLPAFPKAGVRTGLSTVAYQAERELDTLLYQDSGMYRTQQFKRADAIRLQTTYEEIKILWDEEVRFRPNFSTTEMQVNLPVIFAKVSGVKDGLAGEYWLSIKELLTQETYVVSRIPWIHPADFNPMKAFSTEFYKNRRLQKAHIKQHPQFPYAHLREEMQDHILDKLQQLIEQKLIRGTFENGTEYLIVATVLNLPKEIVRMLQSFDFTKKNPKLIYIHPGEQAISLQDAIVTTFLHLVGFDIVFFIPTGYQSMEKYLNQPVMDEHIIGDYLYDLSIPDFQRLSPPKQRKQSWHEKFFKRGT